MRKQPVRSPRCMFPCLARAASQPPPGFDIFLPCSELQIVKRLVANEERLHHWGKLEGQHAREVVLYGVFYIFPSYLARVFDPSCCGIVRLFDD